MKHFLPLLALALSPVMGSTAIAQTASIASGYSVNDTDIGALIDDPAAKAVLDKYVPGFTANPQIDMSRSMTLKAIQQFAGDTLSDEILAKVQADISKLPAKK